MKARKSRISGKLTYPFAYLWRARKVVLGISLVVAAFYILRSVISSSLGYTILGYPLSFWLGVVISVLGFLILIVIPLIRRASSLSREERRGLAIWLVALLGV